MKFSWKFCERKHPYHGTNVTLKEDRSVRGFAIYPKTDGSVTVFWKKYWANDNSQAITVENISDLEIIRVKGECPKGR